MRRRKINKYALIANILLIFASATFLIPMLMTVVMSISNEADITRYGFSLIPRRVSFEAWKIMLSDFSALAKSIWVTLLNAAVKPFLDIAICVLVAYPLSKDSFKYRGIITKIMIFTMFIGPVGVASYIINTRYYGLGNNIMYYILPGFSAWTTFMFRTYFRQVPAALVESAEIDGATEFQVIMKILLPLSKSIFAITYFNAFIGGWNGYMDSLLYMTNSNLFKIQHVLLNILNDVGYLQTAYQNAGLKFDLPIETMKYAVCVLSMIPVMLLFPYMQKYFSKGIAVGSVKG